MVRHTDTWMFNITAENWETCVSGPQDPAIHGESHVGVPVQGVRSEAPAPTEDLQEGDLAFARKKGHGVAGIWEIESVVEIGQSQARSLWNDADYSDIIYCRPIQLEVDPVYEEDWSSFATEFGESVQKVTANIMGAVHNLKSKYKQKYLSELSDHDGINEEARERIEQELMTMNGGTIKRTLPDEVEAWFMNPDGQWDTAIEYDITLTGWREVADADLSKLSESEIRSKFEEGRRVPKTLIDFRDNLPTGSIIVATKGIDKIYGLGVVTGPYHRKEYPELRDNDNYHTRPVRWLIDVHTKHGSPFQLDTDDNNQLSVRHFGHDTGVRQLNGDAYTELAAQILDAYPSLESEFDRLEIAAEAVTARESDEFDTSYFWVNQSNEAEVDGEYLRSPYPEDSWQQDLSRISRGDVIIHRWKGEEDLIIGKSTALDEREVVDDEEYQQVQVLFEGFDEPIPTEPVIEYLKNDDFIESTSHYLINKHHERMTGYLFNLPVKAGNTILSGNFTKKTYEDYVNDLAVPPSSHTVERGHLHFPEEEWKDIRNRVLQALGDGKHVLLFGPPGTGKTKLARQICEATVGENGYELVTASADWSTFDTVGGYHTTTNDGLEFEPGVILDRFQADEDGTPANEWLIIDELNRADIDKAFGSLFTALTGESVTLPFDDSDGDPIEILDSDRIDEDIASNRFYIHDDWQMLATMNTLDKTSLYEMSYAFMRRWAFIPVSIPDLSESTGDETTENYLRNLVGSYVEGWADQDESDLPKAEHHYRPIGRIWREVSEHRALGPAIVEDIYRYVANQPSLEKADYVSPLIMYVFPQLEGLRRDELRSIIASIETVLEDTGDDTDELWTVARDFFQVPDLQRPENTG